MNAEITGKVPVLGLSRVVLLGAFPALARRREDHDITRVVCIPLDLNEIHNVFAVGQPRSASRQAEEE